MKEVKTIMTKVNPASIDFSGKRNVKNPVMGDTPSVLSAPVFSGKSKLSATQWQAMTGVQFGASLDENDRFSAGAADRFYSAIMENLPPSLELSIGETMKRAEVKAREVNSREITPIHFLYGMLQLVQDNFDQVASSNALPQDAGNELKAAKEVYNALFPNEIVRYLPKEAIRDVLDRRLMDVGIWSLRLSNAPTDKMQVALRQYSFALLQQGLDPSEIDARVNELMGPSDSSVSDEERQALLENAPEGIREMLAQTLGKPASANAVSQESSGPVDGPIPRSRELDSVLMELVSDQELTSSDRDLALSVQIPEASEEVARGDQDIAIMGPEATEVTITPEKAVAPENRTIRAIVDKLSNEGFAVSMGSSFIQTQQQLTGLQAELEEKKEVQILSKEGFGEVPEEPEQFAGFLETISPLLGEKPSDKKMGGLYYQALNIARNANSETVKPAHLVLAMVLLAEKLREVKPEFTIGSAVDVPETFKLRDDQKIQAMQTADFPARFARIALDVLIPPDSRENLTSDQITTLLRDTRRELSKQISPTGTRLRDIDPKAMAPSETMVEAMTEASQVQTETGEFPYTLMAAFRQMLATSPDISDQRLGATLEKLSDRAEDRSGLIPSTTFTDVGGQEKAKKELMRAVRRNYNAPAGELKNGILLEGPPGTGKTLLAKAAANYANAVYFQKNGANFASKWVGESQANVNEFFEEAEKHLDEGRRAVIFLDEADALLRKRGENNDGNAGDSAVNAFLERAEIFIQKGGILIAATNFADKLDDAATRPGRLGETVRVDLPNEQERVDILNIHRKQAEVTLADDVDLSQWAQIAYGNSGADLANLIHKAKDEMLDRQELAGQPAAEGIVSQQDMDNAYHEIHMPESSHDEETKRKFLMEDSAAGAGNGLYVAGKSGGVGQFLCNITVTDQGNKNGYPIIEFAPGTPSRNFKDMTHDSVYHALNWVTSNPEKLQAMGFDVEKYRGKRLQITMQSDRGHEMDGDSAGAVMTSSIISALTGRKFRNDVAMTGTILINDRVKAIGGLKYKLHGASNEVEIPEMLQNADRQGMRIVLFPEENLRDEWKMIPPRMKDKLYVVPIEELLANPTMQVPEGKSMIVAAVNNIRDVVAVALEPQQEAAPTEKPLSRFSPRRLSPGHIRQSRLNRVG